MPDIDRIIEQLLGDRRIKESAAFSTRSYTDQPIIERGRDYKERRERQERERAEQQRNGRIGRGGPKQPAERTDRQTQQRRAPGEWAIPLDLGRSIAEQISRRLDSMRVAPLPERIREMRSLEGAGMPSSLTYLSNAASKLFWQQARLMEDYEDDYEFHGTFSQYYPTYAAMSDQQLRGYFSWRSKVRRGDVEPAPLSFAFVHVYELLAGVGTTAGEQALADLRDFGHAYQATDERTGAQLNNYLRRWLRDYAIYHDLPEAAASMRPDALDTAVLALLGAEHAQLGRQGRQPRIANQAARDLSPTPDQLYAALGVASAYHICDSRLAKDEPELLANVACDTFAALVSHCSKRRKTDYVEGLFGYASRVPYTMFSAAVFYEPAPHPDGTVRTSAAETFECKGGRWWRSLACEASGSSAELGLAMHTVDYGLRVALDYAYPLKARDVPKYLQKIVDDAIATRLEERAEAERRRISIDLSQLDAIRAAAALTQEALLTDEDKDEPAAETHETPSTELPLPQPETSEQPEVPEQPEAGQNEATQQEDTACEPEEEGPLDASETQFLRGLVEGVPAAELLSSLAQFPSVVVDSINEKLFDLVGDAVIEFDGDEPRVIEDYLEDIREVLHL